MRLHFLPSQATTVTETAPTGPRKSGYRMTRAAPPGSPPGTLVAHPEAVAPKIDVIRYGPDQLDEPTAGPADELRAGIGALPVTWINVSGHGDLDLLRSIGKAFGLHRLSLADVVNIHQRPKAEIYEGYLFIVTRMPRGGNGTETEQITMVLGENFVLTFQERAGDCFEPVRKRLRRKRGRIRDAGADYLAYALLDAVIDGFYPVLEECGERLATLEDEIIAAPSRGAITDVHHLKHDLLMLRRAIWPQREMINSLLRDEGELISETTRIYLRDCYDHAVQLMDVVETYREIASALVDVYLSSISARLNEVMKVLTIIATIFIPLSFIASVYGMNFDPKASPWNMPELGWRYGYPFALFLMVAVAGGLLYYFRRRGWLGNSRARARRRRNRRTPMARP
ncbi:MAG TPA: magnesium/cobalt transporter CorA [Alphaproteobacteria bacterium]|nr:magnesium/cobalt transporter CorA [Alphaproteobacteria bacterium]